MSKEYLKDDIIVYNEDEDEFVDGDIEESEDNFNIEVGGSPLQAKRYTGDSAIPLQGQYHESSYKDDNISRVWVGLLSYYG